ncbi:MAG: lipoyl(octanoyl) transferase [Burkholderiales bacterium PBB3]|nr:MAG: lipoyl(octanoyl) transferase [Burkholderiales bacterium PBB3]
MELKNLGRVDYLPTYGAMQEFTSRRGLEPLQDVRDQLWICEHPPVFTQGLAGKAEHIFLPGDIPVVQSNRGGQVTYHGPGQVVAYPLIDLQRAGYFVKEYVYRLEEAVIRTLLHFGVTGHRVGGAPGIYVRLDDPAGHAPLEQRPRKLVGAADVGRDDRKLGSDPSAQRAGSDPNLPSPKPQPDFTGLGKIAALGIKVSRHCTYHGVALNVAMDLEPYARINPCGYEKLQTVDLSTIGVNVSWDEAAAVFASKLSTYLAP